VRSRRRAPGNSRAGFIGDWGVLHNPGRGRNPSPFPGAPGPFGIAIPGGFVQRGAMMKLCITAGTFVGGYLAAYAVSSFGMMAEVLASGVGSIIGVYLGWKLARHIER
jgi:hypothetical protein